MIVTDLLSTRKFSMSSSLSKITKWVQLMGCNSVKRNDFRNACEAFTPTYLPDFVFVTSEAEESGCTYWPIPQSYLQ